MAMLLIPETNHKLFINIAKRGLWNTHE